ncbi:hypothetical protein [Hansschlegelia sp.]|uniref:hypothetical protein n=1 Tax=Hansschlegelia sp. TaxID=2041892 RepID=UPI002CBD0C8F|nr:hypothetical protein [Hansschlegelia sp.]HVI28259.1 hypothetical protein [Hansschlegelia sp.]
MSRPDIVERLTELAHEFESVAAADGDDSADMAAAGVIRDAIAEIVALRAAALGQRQAGVVAPFHGGCAPSKDQ